MKVKELIAELEKQPPCLEVVVVRPLWKKKPQSITSCLIHGIEIPLKRRYHDKELVSLYPVKEKKGEQE